MLKLHFISALGKELYKYPYFKYEDLSIIQPWWRLSQEKAELIA